MRSNQNLNIAARVKNDEFYTQYKDIQIEVHCYWQYDKDFLRDKTILLPCDDPTQSNFTKFFTENFTRYGIKKLISTSYEANARGKVFILERGRVTGNSIEYLNGDGDFRSSEVSKLRDEADVIITNPPFSMFRKFFSWIAVANKKFLILGNINAITYKEVFPLIKANKIWLGVTNFSSDMVFGVPKDFEVRDSYKIRAKQLGFSGNYTRIGNSCWITNLEHGRRHKPLKLMTLEENFLNSKHKEVRGVGYQKYDTCDALEVPYVDAIPNDYAGMMAVPITFLDKYCPEQFEILGKIDTDIRNDFTLAAPIVNGKRKFKRIAIRFKKHDAI